MYWYQRLRPSQFDARQMDLAGAKRLKIGGTSGICGVRMESHANLVHDTGVVGDSQPVSNEDQILCDQACLDKPS
jgi:hypothetical protein